MTDQLQATIEAAWDKRESIGTSTSGEVRDAVDAALELLDSGQRSCRDDWGAAGWSVHQWLAKAVSGVASRGGLTDGQFRRPLGRPGWTGASKFAVGMPPFTAAGFRAVPGAIVRKGAYLAPTRVMPSFVNLGAYVGEGTMIDTWATVGSCAQIGKNVHISGGTGIGGVLEPLQAGPVIIEDDCFIGARSEVAEGVVVERGAVISMGVFLGASTKIVDRANAGS